MSGLATRARSGRSFVLVTGNLSGSGTLTIPAGVGLVTITARGGTGWNNYWYNPGQPYIAPTFAWQLYSQSLGNYCTPANYNANVPPAPTAEWGPTGTPTSINDTQSCSWYTGPSTSATYNYKVYSAVQTSAGQPYIAPSSGGGPQYGTSTTATLNGTTRTWVGGYDAGVQGTQSIQTIMSSGAGQSLDYSIGSGGSMSYSYEM